MLFVVVVVWFRFFLLYYGAQKWHLIIKKTYAAAVFGGVDYVVRRRWMSCIDLPPHKCKAIKVNLSNFPSFEANKAPPISFYKVDFYYSQVLYFHPIWWNIKNK